MKMEFKFWGVHKTTRELVGDTTDLNDIKDWIRSRFIDEKEPHGPRPAPEWVENHYKHSAGYVLQKDVVTYWD